MNFRRVALLLGACAIAAGQATATPKQSAPSYADSPMVQDFIEEMHSRHGFDAAHLTRQFARTHPNAAVLRAIRPAAVPELQRSWQRYRVRFLNEARLRQGLRFWHDHDADLRRAEALYGVPQEIIVAIIGVETEYGRNTGKFSVLEALATLAFDYPPRATFFRNELEQFLLMARENGVSPLDYRGSYAGAIGIPQFMPSSQRAYAVDFDGNDRIDLRGSPADAIGSVARFLAMHGWQANAPVAIPARVPGDAEIGDILATGLKPSHSINTLREHRIEPLRDDLDDNRAATLIDLVSPGEPVEYWIGFDNFYVITRYNRSSFYAMSVFMLAESLRESQQADTSAKDRSPRQ